MESNHREMWKKRVEEWLMTRCYSDRDAVITVEELRGWFKGWIGGWVRAEFFETALRDNGHRIVRLPGPGVHVVRGIRVYPVWALIEVDRSSVSNWMLARCERGPASPISTSELYRDYASWAGDRAVTLQKFGRDLSRCGVDSHRISGGVLRMGIKLKGVT